MATQDISRSASDFRKHYHGVQLQQGRVLDDDDFNEADRLAAEVRRRTTVELVGAHGTSNTGFEITDAQVTAGGELDFAIGAGSLFVGGLRAELEQAQRYRLQADWLSQEAGARQAPTGPRVDLVYVSCWQQPVVAIEDAELFEVALGGPDTSTRIRTMARVAVRPNVGTDDCLTAWNAFVAHLDAGGAGTLNAEHELVADARLTVGFDPAGTDPADLCTPLLAGGYLGAENQAIRVQLRPGGSSFTWGFDNASSLYRATLSGGTVTLLTEPKDHLHWPLAGQVVEILPWAARLPNGEKLAEAEGHIARVSASYDPDTRQLTIAPAPPAGFGAEWQARDDSAQLGSQFFYLRVWDRGADTTSPLEIPLTPGTPVPLSGTGLTVRFDGADLRSGDHWIIAARPETPNRVVPWQLEQGKPPDAVRHFIAPLALVRWPGGAPGTAGQVEDCRGRFEPLTECSCGGSCTLVARPGANLQAAVDALPAEGGNLCLQAGVYEVAAPVRVRNRGRLVVSGAGPATIVRATTTEAALVFEGCTEVEVRALRVEGAPEGPPGEEGLDGALTFVGCSDVTVADCALACPDSAGREQTCLTVRSPGGARDRIRIESNVVEIGAWQTGILLVGVERAAVVGNRLGLVAAEAELRIGGGREFVADELARLMGDAVRAEAGGGTRELDVGGTRVHAVSGAAGEPLLAEFARLSTPSSLARARTLDAAMRTFTRDLLRGRRLASLSEPARASIASLLEGLRSGGQGIVAGGRRLGSVQILDNLVEDVVQGIHVGVSHPDTAGRERADDVLISRNVVHLLVPAAYDRDRHAVFVGNARSVHVKDTIATLRRIGEAPSGGPTPVEGVRVHGVLGPFVSLSQTSLTGFGPVGVRVVPLGTPPPDRMWLVSETMASGASRGCEAPAPVEQERNYPSRPGVLPEALSLEQAPATRTAGQEHTVTALVTGAGGAPAAGALVRFAVTGANPDGGSATTDAEGKATFAYTGIRAGTDTITAFADIDGDGTLDAGEPAATATVAYGPDDPQQVTLVPASATKRVAVQHCVTATVTDSFGNATPGVTMQFRAAGANSASGSQQANAEGKAVFCYTGTQGGLDTLQAFADLDNDGQQDVGEPSGTATVTYSGAAEPPDCDQFRATIEELNAEIEGLQLELQDAAGPEKAAIIAQIRAAQRARAQAVVAARAAGCIP